MIYSLRPLQFWVITLLFSSLLNHSSAQQIAITFDDAPTADGPIFPGKVRTEKLIDQLKKSGVEQAAFFVVTNSMDNSSVARIRAYTNAGHLIANHSHTHQRMDILGVSAYLKDISTADSILSKLSAYQKWYRYPFLDEGRSVAHRDSVRTGLARMDLMNGYVTIDNYDWYINALVRQAKARGKKINFDKLKDIYVDHIVRSVHFYDSIANKHLGRSPKHVLLLHENDLAALYLSEIMSRLKKEGWSLISPVEAYEDPIAREVPDVLFNGQGRVAALARAKGIPANQLIQASEDEIYLDKQLQAAGVFE